MLKGIMAWMQGTGHSRQEDSLSKGPEAGCSKAKVRTLEREGWEMMLGKLARHKWSQADLWSR